MLSLFLIIQFPVSYAQTDPILITVSDTMNDVEFDGKWSFPSEWKASSINSMGDQVMIRSAHQDNFVYIFIDVLADASLDRGSFIQMSTILRLTGPASKRLQANARLRAPMLRSSS